MEIETPQIAPELEVIKMDPKTLKVLIRSTAKNLEDQLDQLNSEDAKSLAIAAAVKEGFTGAGIKYQGLAYGDSATGTPARQFGEGHKAEPFLIVEIYSPDIATSQIVGDSRLPASRSF